MGQVRVSPEPAEVAVSSGSPAASVRVRVRAWARATVRGTVRGKG